MQKWVHTFFAGMLTTNYRNSSLSQEEDSNSQLLRYVCYVNN